MKLSWILPVICTMSLGGVLANPVPDVGLSTCAAIARISTDLNNTNTYFSQINASLRTVSILVQVIFQKCLWNSLSYSNECY